MLSLLGLLLLIMGYVATMLAVDGHYRWYWGAAFATWIFSGLGVFSIGIFTLSTTFVLAALAAGHSMGLIRQFRHSLLAASGGLALWAMLLATGNVVAWLLFPVCGAFDFLFKMAL